MSDPPGFIPTRQLREELEREAREQGRPWRGPTPEDAAEVPVPPPNPLANIEPWSVAEEDIPPRNFVYGGHYLREAISATIAPGGRAKTSLTLVEAVSMALGHGLLTGDRIEAGPWRVGVLNAEEPQHELDRRVAAILKHYKVDRAELGGRLFVKSIRGNPLILAAFDGRHIKFDHAAIHYLRNFIRDQALDVWMLDPFASFHHCRENTSDDMNPLVQVALGAVAEETNSAGDIVHHTSKPRAGIDSTVDDARGSSAIINAVRIARVLNFMSSEEAKRYDVPDELRRLHIKYETGKANPTAIGNRRWMRLEVVFLANGDEVICASSFVPRIAEVGLSPEQAATVAKLAQEGPRRADMRADDWFGWHLAKALKIDAAKGYPNEPADIDKLKDIIKAALKAGIIKQEMREDNHRHKRDYFVFAKPLPDATLMSADDIDAFMDDAKLH
jgi:AAA domain